MVISEYLECNETSKLKSRESMRIFILFRVNLAFSFEILSVEFALYERKSYKGWAYWGPPYSHA